MPPAGRTCWPAISQIASLPISGESPPLATQSFTTSPSREDRRLWAIALGLSLLVNAIALIAAGLGSLQSAKFQRLQQVAVPPPAETSITIFPDMIVPAPSTPAPTQAPQVSPTTQQRFARTNESQTATAPEKPKFLGERSTRATSDRQPDAEAPELPSQAGTTPRGSDDLETTESTYRDGSLNDAATQETPKTPATPAPQDPAESNVTQPIESSEPDKISGAAEAQSPPPTHERLLNGPYPVDVPAPREFAKTETPAAARTRAQKEEKIATPSQESPQAKTSTPSATPGFRGNQRKTAIIGSISRTGRSALDVADSPLGRYQAVISRAVEQEWQRNCVRHRDFITPGFLTVRFFVETSGKVRTVQFVGNMETGEVQKGFTLNAIRDAAIPAMPAALKKDFTNEPLELIFNFYF